MYSEWTKHVEKNLLSNVKLKCRCALAAFYRFPVGFPLKSFVDKCCPLSQEEKNTCFGQKVS